MMKMIAVVLLQLLLLQVSISLPLQDSFIGEGPLLNLASLVSSNSSGEKELLLNSNNILNDETSFIVNGQLASRGQFPYQVALFCMINQLAGYQCCGGSLISTNYVLTAAHCLEENPLITNYLVVLGGLDLSQGYEPGRVVLRVTRSNIKLHESYNPVTYKNDIALIKLPRSVLPSAYINVVQLPTIAEGNTQSTFVGRIAAISGWGRTTDSSQSTSSYLRYGYMSVISQAACAQYYKAAAYEITDGQICSAIGSSKANICNGDSGGPLVVPYSSRQLQVGIVSLGATQCEYGFPSAYTRISFYLNWIDLNSDVIVS